MPDRLRLLHGAWVPIVCADPIHWETCLVFKSGRDVQVREAPAHLAGATRSNVRWNIAWGNRINFGPLERDVETDWESAPQVCMCCIGLASVEHSRLALYCVQ